MDDLRTEKWCLQLLRYALNFVAPCVGRWHAGLFAGGGVALAGSELALEEIWHSSTNGPASMTGFERKTCPRYRYPFSRARWLFCKNFERNAILFLHHNRRQCLGCISIPLRH